MLRPSPRIHWSIPTPRNRETLKPRPQILPNDRHHHQHPTGIQPHPHRAGLNERRYSISSRRYLEGGRSSLDTTNHSSLKTHDEVCAPQVPIQPIPINRRWPA